jgi:hypothetical protein
MPSKTWIAEVDGHPIRVENSWTGGAKLYVDGECRDTSNRLTANPSSPALSARLVPNDASSPLVEVFVSALFTVKAKICINGRQVAGDAF